MCEGYKKSVHEIDKEMNANSENENLKQVDSIMQKDKEYSKFIDNFSEIRDSVKN